MQGIFLAVGERLAGHPAIGVWLSSALACAALVWMLQAWISRSWALLGGLVVVIQYGVYSTGAKPRLVNDSAELRGE